VECRASLIYAHLLMSGLDHDEVRQGQLCTILAAASVILLAQLLIVLLKARSPGGYEKCKTIACGVPRFLTSNRFELPGVGQRHGHFGNCGMMKSYR
jgi:hypothetical protein